MVILFLQVDVLQSFSIFEQIVKDANNVSFPQSCILRIVK